MLENREYCGCGYEEVFENADNERKLVKEGEVHNVIKNGRNIVS